MHLRVPSSPSLSSSGSFLRLALELLGLRRADASRALENLNTPLRLFLDAEFVLILIFHVQHLPSRDLPDAAGILTAQDVICCGIGD